MIFKDYLQLYQLRQTTLKGLHEVIQLSSGVGLIPSRLTENLTYPFDGGQSRRLAQV